MIVDRKELLEAVKRCMIATTKDANVLGSHTIAFNETTLQAYNDVIGVSVDFTTDITACVDAAKLLSAVNNFTNDTVNISIKDEKVVLKSGKATSSLGLQDVNLRNHLNRPLSLFDDAVFTPLPIEFPGLLANAIVPHRSNKDREDMKLIGVYVSGCDIISATNLCFHVARFEGNIEPIRLPDKTAITLSKYQLDSVASIGNWVMFISDGVKYFARQYDREMYPIGQVRRVLEGYTAGKVLASVDCTVELINALKVAKQYADPIQPICSIGFGDAASVKVVTEQNAYEEFIENSSGEGVYKLRPDMLLFLCKDADSLSVREYSGRKSFVSTKEGTTIIHAVMEV